MQRMCEAMREMGFEPGEDEVPDDRGSCEIISTAEELHKMQLQDGEKVD